MPTGAHYDDGFYAAQRDGSVRSARAIVPLALDALHPSSFVDVGCGVGGWLEVFREGGVTDTGGIDGDKGTVDVGDGVPVTPDAPAGITPCSSVSDAPVAIASVALGPGPLRVTPIRSGAIPASTSTTRPAGPRGLALGNGAVVGAGAEATQDVVARTIVAGSACKAGGN